MICDSPFNTQALGSAHVHLIDTQAWHLQHGARPCIALLLLGVPVIVQATFQACCKSLLLCSLFFASRCLCFRLTNC